MTFNLWPPSGTIPPATVEFDSRRPYGQGEFCRGLQACEAATWGKVVLGGSSDGGMMAGEWELGLEDGTVRSGTFTADWLTIQALCG